jgi:hypothetical protein
VIHIIYLIVFLVGAVSALCLYPIAESATELVLTAIEAKKVKISLQINQYSKKVQEIQEEMTPQKSFNIGFDIEQEGEDFEVYEEE